MLAFVAFFTMLSFFETCLLKMKRKGPPVSKHSYLCSEHFSEDCFMRCVGRKKYPKVDLYLQDSKSRSKAPVYHSAVREKTKRHVKDEVILNSQSKPVICEFRILRAP